MKCDTLIVGGGLAGLVCAREILKRKPNQSLIVCEKYKKLGGRAVTFHKDDLQWEIGAGRISDSHTLVLGLIKEYGLHVLPIESGLTYRETGRAEKEENHFEPAIEVVLGPLRVLPADVLATQTLKEVMMSVYGKSATQKWMDRFPYDSEITVMRADMALKEFFGEMRSHEGYFVCKEGLSALVDALAADVRSLGGIILAEYELKSVKKGCAEFWVGSWKDGHTRPTIDLQATKIVLALHATALRSLDFFATWKPLDYVAMKPLFRIYAVFPSTWFLGLGRVVTTSPIRYFLPMNEEKGTAMVSYTDNTFATHYMNILDAGGEKALQKAVMKDLRELFPETDIPEPIFFKPHPWTDGVSYWLPGDYVPERVSTEALHPFPGIYICGESFSLRQGWMEGALEHATRLVNEHF